MLDSDANKLNGVTAIIVEDNMLVADSTKFALETLDCRVAGMAGTLEGGLQLVQSKEFDVAILDLDLRGRSIAPVARAVQERNKAFLFVSGYGDEKVLPEEFRAIQRLDKPVDVALLVAAIRRAVGDS
jgi:DNA-binding NarL/FixJ family response regulator